MKSKHYITASLIGSAILVIAHLLGWFLVGVILFPIIWGYIYKTLSKNNT